MDSVAALHPEVKAAFSTDAYMLVILDIPADWECKHRIKLSNVVIEAIYDAGVMDHRNIYINTIKGECLYFHRGQKIAQ